MLVLIAEDEPDIRDVLQESVSSFGYECLVAADGDEAWDLYQAHGADIIITDWRMPRMTGLELCQKVRALDDVPYTFIIMLTALADEEHLLQGMEAGADDYFPKPFTLNALQARLVTAERVTALQRRREVQLRLGRSFAAEPNAEQLVRSLLEEAVRLVGADAGGVFHNPDADTEAIGWQSEPIVAHGIRERVAVQRALAALTDRDDANTVVLNDYQSQLLLEASEHMTVVQAAVATPLKREGRLLGTLVVVTFDDQKQFSPRDAESLEILGGLAAGALLGLERNQLAGMVRANASANQALDSALGPTAAISEQLAGDTRLPDELRGLAHDVRQGLESALRSVRDRLASPPSGEGGRRSD